MRLSIIIPVYNGAEYVEQAIASAFSEAPDDAEVIVADDGSGDATRTIAEQVGSKQAGRFRLISHAEGAHRGPGATRNLGVAAARGDLVAFLDADDYYLPGRFDEDVPRLTEDSALDGVYGLTRVDVEEAAVKKGRTGLEYIGLPAGAAADETLEWLLKERFWHANALTVRRSLLLQVGGFDERLRMAEDCLLWFKLAVAGRLCPSVSRDPVAVYRRRKGSTHRLGAESMDCLLQAMATATAWARQEKMPGRACRLLRQGTWDYFVKIAGAARIKQNSREARCYLDSAIRILGWRFFTEPRAAWLALRILSGNLFKQHKAEVSK